MESKISNWSDVTFIPKEVKINVMAENISTKEIQIIMAKDSVMKEHKAPFPIHVQVLKGDSLRNPRGFRKEIQVDFVKKSTWIP